MHSLVTWDVGHTRDDLLGRLHVNATLEALEHGNTLGWVVL